jgi:hypothetical protein
MPKVIGYFEGTNPEWLTALVAMGHSTLPVSNGYDGHGKNVRQYNANNKDDLVIGYLHKVVSPPAWEATTADILHGIVTYEIPCLLVVPEAHHAQAESLLGRIPASVRLVDPGRVMDELNRLL